ncbi:MAG TPA: hemerythrin domain-containing protein [Terriglobales bacterium]|nr:hemerythrin domain-containing protein [Terriglobales bacterium]
MLTGIRTPNADPAGKEETPLELLLGCHQRIRHFTAIARRMAENPTASLDEISEAAAAVYRYFHVALPLHEADENISLDPRLHDVAEVSQASEEMVRQHTEINRVLKQLLPLWDALCREPEKLPRFASRIMHLVSELERLWDAHLCLEEEQVFPAIQRLPREEVAAILSEMKERRRSETRAIA